MRCSKSGCQSTITPGAKFCSKCGTPVPSDSKPGSKSGITTGDFGYFEGSIQNTSQQNAPSIGSIQVNVPSSQPNAEDSDRDAHIFCKSCGGYLSEIAEGKVFKCDYCGICHEECRYTHSNGTQMALCKKCARGFALSHGTSPPTEKIPQPSKPVRKTDKDDEKGGRPQKRWNRLVLMRLLGKAI